MEAQLDGDTIRLGLDGPESVRRFFAGARRQGGFLLTLQEAPKLFETKAFVLSWGEAREWRLSVRVLQVFPAGSSSHGVAFELTSWGDAEEAELERRLSAQEGGTSEESAASSSSPDTSLHLGASPIHRIKGMNPSQRMQLATKAGRVERQVLLRDTSPQVLQGLLANPRLENDDVLQIVKSTIATGAILKRVANDRRWSNNAEIRLAVVRNPKTPLPLAIRLLDTLRTPDLGQLAKASSAREPLRRAALKLYLGRMSKR